LISALPRTPAAFDGIGPPSGVTVEEVVVMDVVVQRCAGIDVSKRDAKVCVRVQGSGSRRTSTRVSTWTATSPQIIKLRDQLLADRVELVVMESTSDYWRPFFYLLSEELSVILVKASDVRALPGRKSDVSDSEWLADLAAHGLVRASFVPPENVRQLRDLTRARTFLFTERTREVQRLEKELEDACIKLAGVVSNLQGLSSRAMLEALVNHEDDPAVLAELARGKLRAKIGQLTDALTGRFNDHHRFMVRFRLDRIDQSSADIDRLDRRIDELIEREGFTAARDLICSVPGLGRHGAEELIAELGIDMSIFPTPNQLASWVGVAPGSHESAGVRKHVRTRPGNHYAKRALGIAAMSAARSRTTFFSARFRRVRARQGYARALVATEHSIVTAIWHMLSNGEYYHDLGADYYNRRTPARALRHKIKDLEAAGYTVTAA
jgi:transposase